MASPIVGPIPAQSNPPINPQYYQPRMYFISALTYGVTTLVTTSVDHDYVVGQQVRLIIPSAYGAQQINNQQGMVISIPSSTQVEVTINSTMANAFTSGATNNTSPQILAIGDMNSGAINASGRNNTGTYILGSFINISPQ